MTDELKVFDKRHWVSPDASPEEGKKEEGQKRLPTFVARLEEQVAQSDAKLKEYITAYKEKMAENDQFRARLEKDVDRRVEARQAEFFRKIVPGIDHLDLAIASARKTKDVDGLIEGVIMIKSLLLRIFSEYGVKEIECLGKPFNPAEAEALQLVEVREREMDNIVVEVVEAGFAMNGMLVRPAKVLVGRFKE